MLNEVVAMSQFELTGGMDRNDNDVKAAVTLLKSCRYEEALSIYNMTRLQPLMKSDVELLHNRG